MLTQRFLVKKTKIRTLRPGEYGAKGELPGSRQMKIRLGLVGVFFALFGVAIVFRLVGLQVVNGSYYYALASDQHEIFQQLYPQRGTIYFQEKGLDGQPQLSPVASNRELNLLYAEPKNIQDPEAVVSALFEVIDFTDEITNYKKEVTVTMSEELTAEEVEAEKQRLEKLAFKEAKELFTAQLLEKLSKKNDPYEPIKHRVADDQIAKVKSYGLQGLGSIPEQARFYPEKNLGSHLLGFVGHSSENNMLKGYYGIEGYYNKILSGEPGFLRSELDLAGRWIAVAGKEFKKATDGSDLVLTIDKPVQFYACEQLFFGVNNFEADGGSIIIMEPKTGAIIAMCSYPDFDPNDYNKVKDVNVFNNPALLNSYEPGSVFKPMTMAAALDSGAVTPFTTYEDKGEEKIDIYTIKNSDKLAHGIKNMTEVLELSLNTGTIFAARKVGGDKFIQYVKDFGFGSKTNIDLAPEAGGDIKSLETGSEIYVATSSFGQGLTVTPLQMVKAYAAIANEGKLMQPYVVDKIISPDGIEEKTQSKIVGQVISPQTAKILGSMMVSVIQNGHGAKAGVPGYLIAGKTGTAQVPDSKNGGYSDQVIHTFIGFAPYENPKFVMLVKLDNVKKGSFAESTATPIFGKIAKYMLDYYGIAPTVK
jgi:cell division protein FtsI/penicillin-binding protein 2